jgi:hypothetical protein
MQTNGDPMSIIRPFTVCGICLLAVIVTGCGVSNPVSATPVQAADETETLAIPTESPLTEPPSLEPGSTPTETPTPSVPPTPLCNYDAAYVTDLTIPDSITMPAGAAFIKYWRIRNSGPCAWPAGMTLEQTAGDRVTLNGDVVPLDEVPAGSEVYAGIPLVLAGDAPSTSQQRAEFQLRALDGRLFGPALSVLVTVGDASAPTPSNIGGWGGGVRGRVWMDDGDGLLEDAENGIEGISILLGLGRCPSDYVVAIAVSDDIGQYQFDGLKPSLICISIQADSDANGSLLGAGKWTAPLTIPDVGWTAFLEGGLAMLEMGIDDYETQIKTDFGWAPAP